MAQTAADAFDYQAINIHMAKQLVKDLLEAFDAEGNRSRLARALVTAQEKTDALMLNVTPLAIDIAAAYGSSHRNWSDLLPLAPKSRPLFADLVIEYDTS